MDRPTLAVTLQALREDLRRYGSPWRAALAHGAWATCGYRFDRWSRFGVPRPVGWLLRPVALLVRVWVEMATHIQLPAEAEIGPGFMVAHTGYVVVAAGVVLGPGCTLTQGVTLGHRDFSNQSAVPRLGAKVYVGPGAAVLGRIEIGDAAVVGAGAVVIQSIPAGAVAVGVPARVLSAPAKEEHR